MSTSSSSRKAAADGKKYDSVGTNDETREVDIGQAEEEEDEEEELAVSMEIDDPRLFEDSVDPREEEKKEETSDLSPGGGSSERT